MKKLFAMLVVLAGMTLPASANFGWGGGPVIAFSFGGFPSYYDDGGYYYPRRYYGYGGYRGWGGYGYGGYRGGFYGGYRGGYHGGYRGGYHGGGHHRGRW